MNMMTYQGYAARIEYREADGCFVGHIAGIRDVIGFSWRIRCRIAKRLYLSCR